MSEKVTVPERKEAQFRRFGYVKGHNHGIGWLDKGFMFNGL